MALRKKFSHYKYLIYILPAFALWLIFSLYPQVQTLWLAFFKWNGISKDMLFVGFDNFRSILAPPELWRSALNTLLYVVFLLAMILLFGVTLAALLQRNTRVNRFFRSAVFFPFVFSAAAIGLTFGYLYSPTVGVLGGVVDALKLPPIMTDPLTTPVLGVLLIVVSHIWHGIGVPMTICLAGLVSIPDDLYEASTVDGASNIRQFFSITLPLLMPTLSRILMLNLIVGVVAFDYTYSIRNAMQVTRYDTLASYMYRMLTNSTMQNVGLPSAIGFILAVIILVFFLIQFFVTRRIEDNIS